MTFLTRQVDQALLIGDEIRVAVVSIAADSVVLLVSYVEEGKPVEQTCTLERDDRVEIAPTTAVHVMDIRGDRVRLGVQAADDQAVTRQELRADAPNPPATRAQKAQQQPRKAKAAKPAAISKRHRTHHVVAGIDQPVRVGVGMTVRLTDVDATGVRVLIDGELVGGPDDGLQVREARELPIGGALPLGTQVTIVLEKAEPSRATLAITAPTHVDIA